MLVIDSYDLDAKTVTFVGTAYKIDPTVEKGHPITLRTIWVHSEDEIPKIDHPTENADDPAPSAGG